jgi:hypothetical protein
MTMDSRINTLCDELSKMKIGVVPSGALDYISIEPTLLDQIIMAQLVIRECKSSRKCLTRRPRSTSASAKTVRKHYGRRPTGSSQK